MDHEYKSFDLKNCCLIPHNVSHLKYNRIKVIPRVQHMVSPTCALEGFTSAKKSEWEGRWYQLMLKS